MRQFLPVVVHTEQFFTFMSREKSGNLINNYVTIALLGKNFTYICMLDMMVNT
jgi:hypothetical protein